MEKEELKNKRVQRIKEGIIEKVLFASAALSVLTTIGILGLFLFEAIGFFEKVSIVEFLTGTLWTPLFEPKHFGVLPLVAGTIIVTLIAIAVAVPIGLLTAIFLSEYASENLRHIVKPVLEILAGIPTVVYGYFALTYVTPLLQLVFPQIIVQ